MERIRKFPDVSAYEAEKDTIPTPNVCWCVEEDELEYERFIPYSERYLTFEAIEDGTFKFSGNNVNYSLDNGTTWTELENGSNSPTVSAGNQIMFKATLTPSTGWPNYGIGTFSSTAKFNAIGNPMSLLYGDNFIGQSNLNGKDYAFYKLFKGCTNLVDAKNLSLPATTLANYCYNNMLSGCTSLEVAPSLPATTLAKSCYFGMLANTNLLPDVTNIKFINTDGSIGQGLQGLFYGTNITDEQLDSILKSKGIDDYSLPATTLTEYCYQSMFYGCTSLTTAPSIKATTLATYCCNSMFSNCTSLTTAPSLSATSLGEYCYYNMFYNCTSLEVAPELPATSLAYGCYRYMFEGCSKLTTAPTLPATSLTEYCYANMFKGCALLATAPSLPATTLADYCYQEMFYGCTSLQTAPELSATTLTNGCYQDMFRGCTSLTTAPTLPATTLKTYCYRDMFNGCTNLNSITCLATNISAYRCILDWVTGVASTGTFVKAASMSSWATGTSGIPSGWTVQDHQE